MMAGTEYCTSSFPIDLWPKSIATDALAGAFGDDTQEDVLETVISITRLKGSDEEIQLQN